MKLVRVKKGNQSTEHHRHLNDEEFVYILAGRGFARVGDERFEIGAGDFLGYRKSGPLTALKIHSRRILSISWLERDVIPMFVITRIWGSVNFVSTAFDMQQRLRIWQKFNPRSWLAWIMLRSTKSKSN